VGDVTGSESVVDVAVDVDGSVEKNSSDSAAEMVETDDVFDR